MDCKLRLAFRLVAFLLLAVPLLAVGQQRPPRISEDEIEQHFSKSPDCEGVNIDNLEYFDFMVDGSEEAVVVASTCATGTAGPDVHAVLKRLPDGSLAELKIPEPTEKQLAALFCRCFSDLNVAAGMLVGTYHDQSGRDDPLVIKYRWNAEHKEFQIAEVKVAPRYKTSFDCDKTKTPIDDAICYSESVAALDVRLSQRYAKWLDTLNNADSDVLMKEQKDWLRKRNLICGNDEAIASCLETLYSARLLEVDHFRYLHPASPAP